MIWKRDEAEGSDELGGTLMAEQQGGEVTIVGQGAKLEGTIVSAGSLRVDEPILALLRRAHVEAERR